MDTSIDNRPNPTTEDFSQSSRRTERPQKKRRRVLAMLILGFSFLAAYLGGWAAKYLKSPDQSPTLIDELAVSNTDLDMGEVWEAKDIVWRLPIRNLSNELIEIRKFVTSCDCTAIEPSSLSIPPGETATINLNIDLTHRLTGEYDLNRRPFALSIQPITRRNRRDNLAWRLHGVILSRVTLDARTVHFGEEPIHGQKPVRRRLLATVHVPCQQLEVSVNPLIATASVKRNEAIHNLFQITIAINPTLKPGNFQTEAKISVVGSSGERTLAFILPIAGMMQPEVRLLPARVLLEPKPIGDTVEAVVMLQTSGDATVSIDHIEIDDPGLRIEPARIDGIPTGRAYRFRQQIIRKGSQTSTARFIIRKTDQTLVTLTVEVSYYGEQSITTKTEKGKS